MIQLNEIVNPNVILLRALADNPNLSIKLRETLRKLRTIDKSPAKITRIDNVNGITLTLKVQDSYNSLPAVMCQGYNGGQGVTCYFETMGQAEMLLNNKKTVELVNLSPATIETQQLVKLIYNNKNLLVIPATDIKNISDYQGVIGKATTNILPYQTGKVTLLDISQAMDLASFHKLTIRHFGG